MLFDSRTFPHSFNVSNHEDNYALLHVDLGIPFQSGRKDANIFSCFSELCD